MKALVVYYSRTGNTRKIGQEIAKKINADIDEIIDSKNRAGIWNWIFAGRDGMKKKLTQIKYSKNPEKYDLIIIGTPIWVSMAPAVRTYLSKNKDKIKKIAFFITSGSGKAEKTLLDLISISKSPIAVLSIREKDVKSNNHTDKLNDFCKKIK